MPLTRTQKQKIINTLKEKIAKQKMIIFIDFAGLKVKALSELRRKLKDTESELKIAKKSLIAIAFKESKLEVQPKELKGEIALVFSYGDEISPAKIVYQFSQENENVKILGGFFEEQFRGSGEICTLAQLPGREELLAQLLRNISAPVSGLVNLLGGNLRNLVYILSELQKVKA